MKNGFTLIELLMAISIISVISVVGLNIFAGSQAKARDSVRKNHLQAIATALEIYYQQNGSFPVMGSGTPPEIYYSNSIRDPWITQLNSSYMNIVPRDPINNGGKAWVGSTTTYGYMYWAGNTKDNWGGSCNRANGQFFVVAAVLENANDGDTLAKKDYKWCDGASLLTSHGWSPKAYVITSDQ